MQPISDNRSHETAAIRKNYLAQKYILLPHKIKSLAKKLHVGDFLANDREESVLTF